VDFALKYHDTIEMSVNNDGYYKPKGNYSGKKVTGQATSGILASECGPGALKKVLENTRPTSGNTKAWNNSESARASACDKYFKWKNGQGPEPTQEEVEDIFNLAEWARQLDVGEAGSVETSGANTVASNPRARRTRRTRRARKTRRNRKNTRRH
jgi:hypothetical protein